MQRVPLANRELHDAWSMLFQNEPWLDQNRFASNIYSQYCEQYPLPNLAIDFVEQWLMQILNNDETAHNPESRSDFSTTSWQLRFQQVHILELKQSFDLKRRWLSQFLPESIRKRLYGGKVQLDTAVGIFSYGWFNPRTGDGLNSLLKMGSIREGQKIEVNAPDTNDWLLVVKGNGRLKLASK